MKNIGINNNNNNVGLPPKVPHNHGGSGDHGAKTERIIPVNKWLASLDLQLYEDMFKNYKNVQDMLHLNEADLKQMGVKNGSHRARIASSLYLLREKLQGRIVLRKTTDQHKSPVGSNRSTPTHTPPSVVNHPDYYQTTSAVDPQQYEPLHQVMTPTGLQGNSNHDYPLHNQRVISKHLWYHGAIPRTKAETLVKEDGDFLIRDSISQKGDFVLTVCWNHSPLHFMVNRQSVVDKVTGATKVQYQFEDILCDSVPQLISRYVKEQKVISEASQARISNPVNRRISADSLNMILSSPGCAAVNNTFFGGAVSSSSSSAFNPTSSQDVSRFGTDKRPRRTGSQPLLSLDDNGSDGGILALGDFNNASHGGLVVNQRNSHSNNNKNGGDSSGNNKTTTVKTLIHHHQNHIRSDSEPMISLKKGSKLKRTGLNKSQELVTASSDSDLSKPPPPKPSRVPTVKLKDANKKPMVAIRNKKLYDDEKDYSDYAAVKSWPANVKRTVDTAPMLNALEDLYRQFRTSDGSNTSEDSGYQEGNNNTYDPVAIKLPESQPASKFNLADYDSQILTPNNKPLEGSAQGVILPMLLEMEAKSLALHSTLLDLDLLKVIGNHDLGLGVKSGLELITLPHGSQLRKDTLERFHCMKLFVSSTILLSVKPVQRAKMVHQWVQTAHCMRNLGNLFGFAYVMDGLQLEQIQRLKKTWQLVDDQHHTSFLLFESKLKSTYKSLCEAGSALPLQNVCLPYITPLVDLLERDNTHEHATFPWERLDTRADMGVDILLSHLDIARIITEQHGLYTVTSRNILGNFRPIRDALELLDTRMHLKFLWGAKGAGVGAKERYGKYEQILSAMSYKCEAAVSKESSL